MRTLGHKKTIAFGGVVLIAACWFATTHWTTRAAVTPAPRPVVQPAAFVETRPIVPAEIAEVARGKAALDSTSRTDW